LYQIPGTHDLLRPVVHFEEGYPESLEISRTEIYFAGDERRGLIILLGDEPHMDIERYSAAVLHLVHTFNVRRTVCLGGVYGELPYNRERPVHGVVSQPALRAELRRMAVTLSDYQGGASIGSYLCKRAGDAGLEMVGLYSFVPTYDFSAAAPQGGVVRIENDFTAWLGVMRRLNYMFGLSADLTDLEQRSRQLHDAMAAKMSEIDRDAPQLGVHEYMQRLSDEFEEKPFLPDDEFWEEKLNGLFDEEE
jgi:proteasome assembly chaperone (PAC2) family protein